LIFSCYLIDFVQIKYNFFVFIKATKNLIISHLKHGNLPSFSNEKTPLQTAGFLYLRGESNPHSVARTGF
jgi:hypothetical protein